MKYLFEYWLFGGTAYLLQRLSLRAVQRIARILAVVIFYFIPIRRRLTIEQLTAAFPERSTEEIRSLALGSYVNLVTTIFELMWTPMMNDNTIPKLVRLKNPEIPRRAMERGTGLILMSGHVSNWEWLCIGVPKSLGITLTAIIHPMHNPRVDDLVEGYRSMHGNRVVPLGVAIRDIIRSLRSNRTVALLADQSGPSGALYVKFFGRYAATYEGPAMFALRTGAPLVMGFSVRQEDGTYEVEFEEMKTDDLTDGSQEDIQELTRRHVRCLERAIRRHPESWLWQHKRWKHEPGPGSILIDDPTDE